MSNQDEKKSLRELAREVANNAHSPYSNAKVGSAVLMESGEIFTGCNVENSSFGGTVCAERVAIFSAVAKGQKAIKQVYVYSKDGWPPCGFCRQVMTEFGNPEIEITIGNEVGDEKTYKLKELLPLAFTPETFSQSQE